MDISRAFSSGAESDTVVPSATEPRRLTAPASNSRASFSEVLPLPRWPTKATLRILFAPSCGMGLSFLSFPERKPTLQGQAATRAARRQTVSPSGSPWRRDFRRRTALVCSWETRDSVTPRTSPISRRVRFS